MSSLIVDQRPLNPNKQYLQQKQEQYKRKKQLHEYLKKHQFNDKVLPCFRGKLQHDKDNHQDNIQNKKSKAEIYEEIKRKNKEKFGQKKLQQKNTQNYEKIKKIDPLKMTVNYKPKKQISIDTTQYKLAQKEFFQSRNMKSPNSNITQSPQGQHFQETAKQKYEKLLQILRKQKQELNEEKQNFQKHKDKLQFKKLIQKESTVPFINQIREEIKQKKRLQMSHRVQCKAKDNQEENTNQKIIKKKKPSNVKPQTHHHSLSQIQQRITQFQQQKQELQQELNRKKHQFLDPNDVVCRKYSIQEVNQIPAFDIECFKDFIDFRTLKPEGNEFYQVAIKVFQTGLTVKQAKMKLNVSNLDGPKENSQQILSSIDFKRKYQGALRITKYSNGWIQVWNPGIQRLMANKNLSYKVIWLRNGDIKQQWQDKKLQTYYRKDKQVVQIKFDKFEPIFYFTKLNQLQQYEKKKNLKIVLFKETRIQTFEIEEDNMNGFVV